MSQFQALHPVLPVRSVPDAIAYYTQKLGFTLHFQDDPENPRYAAVARDQVCFHLQWHAEEDFTGQEGQAGCLRFVIAAVDALFEEYRDKGVFHAGTAVQNTPWGTREFAFYDPDSNALFFYRPL